MLWFHITRVPLGTTFSEGVLPTKQNAERIWDFVKVCASGILSESDVSSLRILHEELDGEIYQRKIADDGPNLN